jgi:protein-S-isoprenylcysteine O-methyltransferase Ste14
MLTGFCLILIIYGGILFIPAGTLRFWQAWAFLVVLVVPTFSGYCYFYRVDPQLLERRLRQKEQVREQKLLMRWVKPLFLIVLAIPGFDHRFGWSKTLLGGVPLWLTVVSDAMVLAGILSVAWVIKINRFAGRTIQVDAGQKVVTTGPYRFVRHPMYAASSVLFIFTPLALGSWVAWPAFALLSPTLVIRILNEEKVLREQLAGYTEYCQRTRFRLIPFVW